MSDHADTLMLRALRREPTPRPPVWLMRQAGRYLPEYQEVRKQAGGFLAMATNPELAAEVTLQPVRRFGVDAAILFSDILVPLQAMGMDLRFEDGRGPVFEKPLREEGDIRALLPVDPSETLSYVGEALRLTRAGLSDETTLLGFCGAPFTLASYAVEGGGSANHANLRRLMYRRTELYEQLMDNLAVMVAEHLKYQIACGAQAVVLFDTWAGQLTREDYLRYALPWTERALAAVQGLAPRIGFIRGGDHLLDDLVGTGVEGAVLDWRTDIAAAFDEHGGRVALQGNLDPAALLAPPDEVSRRARAILDQVGGRPGHILSLGHGVMKETDPASVAAFVAVAMEAGS
ncbi:MAG: uroporphyrinogen decarboxylase [Planctomycetota bacterium]|jgi:uroporphyrinogen decarboxylase